VAKTKLRHMDHRRYFRRTVAALTVALGFGVGVTAVSGSIAHAAPNTASATCTNYVVTSPAVDVWTFPFGDETWMTWQSGDSFCDFGTNAAGDRYQVFVYCAEPFCHRGEGTFIGWVTTDPSYYAAPLAR
jgi:hypothetical protein